MKRFISLFLALCAVLTMVPAVLAANPFVDVAPDAWYAADVENAYTMGLINGKTETNFAPADNLTYAEAAKLAACMHQRYTTGAVTLTNGDPWYQSYVDYCKENGIITKDYPWNFNATRSGYMEIFSKALPAEALSEINLVEDGSIPDVSMSHPQAAAIYALYRAGILQGNDAEHNCNPSASIQRSEVAAILTRMMDSAERIFFTMELDEDEDEEEDKKDEEKKEEDKEEDKKDEDKQEDDKKDDDKTETNKPEQGIIEAPKIDLDDPLYDPNNPNLGDTELPVLP